MRFEMLLRLDAAVRLADGQIRVAAEQMERNFLVVIHHGFLADPVKAGHGDSFFEKWDLRGSGTEYPGKLAQASLKMRRGYLSA